METESFHSKQQNRRIRILRWIRSTDGSTAVEYAIMIGLLTAVMLGTVRSLGKAAGGTLSTIADQMAPAPDDAIPLPNPGAPPLELGPPVSVLPGS